MGFSLVRAHALPWLIVAAAGMVGSGQVDRMPPGLTPLVSTVRAAGVPAAQPGDVAGCYTPKFTVSPVPIGVGLFAGTITGDIQGTVMLTFVGPVTFRGATIANGGTAHWEITGGVIPGIVSFDTVFENRNLESDRPGSPAWLFENIGRHRAVDGVGKANLAYTGTFDVSIPAGDHEYQGVICL